MRCRMLVVAVFALGCARTPQLVVSRGALGMAGMLARHPLAPTANIRADEIERTVGSSVHLVQVRRGETPHRHDAHDLVIAVVRGEGVLNVGGAARPMRAGDVAVVPRGAVHWFVNTGPDAAVAVVVFAPPLDAPDVVPVVDVDSREEAR